MTKQFFDVFPTLKVNSDCKVLFENVEVTKVTTNSDRDYLHVHLFSTHLLAKSWIYKMETMIKEQLFGRNRIRIRIYEDYQLSGQYTPENLMNEYRESILLELKERSVVEHNMFLNAKYHFENENHLYLKLDDTIVAQGKQDSIVGLLKCSRNGAMFRFKFMWNISRQRQARCRSTMPVCFSRRSMRLWKRMQQNLRQKKRRKR